MFKCKKCSWAPPSNWNSSSDSIGRQLKNAAIILERRFMKKKQDSCEYR